MIEKAQWYDNKTLYEMMVNLSKGLEKTSAELAKTQVLIRDYNSLRERLGKCEQHIERVYSLSKGGKEMWGFIVGGVGLALALISYATR